MPDTPPAASTTEAEAELHCPLCTYSLRGLPDPRCPECGYAFDWDELRRAHENRHPYLFEHARGLGLRRLVSTFVHGLLPRRFWRSVQAGHAIAVKRLLIYWSLVALAILLATADLSPFRSLVWRARQLTDERSRLTALLNNPTNLSEPWFPNWRANLTRGYPSTQAYIDAQAPSPLTPEFYSVLWSKWINVDGGFGDFHVEGPTIFGICYSLAWPWATLVTMAVFRQSRGKARVRSAQLIRCTVYCSDVFSVLSISVIITAVIQTAARGSPITWYVEKLSALACALALGGIASYRLAVAYRNYLRFPHPTATVVAVHLVTLLAAVFIGSLTDAGVEIIYTIRTAVSW